jgi:hypothetical protein
MTLSNMNDVAAIFIRSKLAQFVFETVNKAK